MASLTLAAPAALATPTREPNGIGKSAGSGVRQLPALLALLLLSLALGAQPNSASFSTLGFFGQQQQQQQAGRNQSIKTTTTCAPVKRLLSASSASAFLQPQRPVGVANEIEAKLSKEAMREIASQLGYTELGGNKKDDFKNLPGHDYNGPAEGGQQEATLAGPNSKQEQQYKYKLPSWFDYELYKRFFGKKRNYQGMSGSLSDNEIHKRIYLRTALKVFEQQALYRAARTNIVTSINELSDLTSGELLALKGRRLESDRQVGPEVPDCCTYEQLYTRIIDLLNKTSNGLESADLTLSRAMLDGLEQKPLLQLIGNGRAGGSNFQEEAWQPTSGSDWRQQSKAVTPTKPTSQLAYIGADAAELLAKAKQLNSKGDNKASAANGKIIEGELDGQDHRPMVLTKGQQLAAPSQLGGPNEAPTVWSPSTSGAAGSGESPTEGGGTLDKSMARAIEDSVRKQVIEQLTGDSALARQLKRQFSAYFGQPVVIKATIADQQASTKAPPLKAQTGQVM